VVESSQLACAILWDLINDRDADFSFNVLTRRSGNLSSRSISVGLIGTVLQSQLRNLMEKVRCGKILMAGIVRNQGAAQPDGPMYRCTKIQKISITLTLPQSPPNTPSPTSILPTLQISFSSSISSPLKPSPPRPPSASLLSLTSAPSRSTTRLK
jgi:hypothetical protein